MWVTVALAGIWVIFLIRKVFSANNEIEEYYRAHYTQSQPISQPQLSEMENTYNRYSTLLTITIFVLVGTMFALIPLKQEEYAIAIFSEAAVGAASYIFQSDYYSWQG